ncbi:MAG: insulinase family protein [Ignavibacteriales bacterium]|nr:MAG: insulinase family protein [Ignavibacteriales bacterium]
MKKMLSRIFLVLFIFSFKATFAQKIDEIEIPFQKFILDNGLTLIVHEDHKAPIVAVNIWYHVGSKNEKAGKTGFAHLFEHLMFNGSENYNNDYFQALERVGATDLNGTTSEDRTNYFQNVPTSAVDLALWMESDRMGHLIGAITQDKLDEQRGVVQNEKRQGQNQPYSVAWDLIPANCYPKGHPYSWTVIGEMEDLDSAKLSDVHEWFKTYYGPNNAVLVVAGDITAEDALEKVKKYFGDIPPGPPISKYESNVAKMSGSKRMIVQDRVPQERIMKIWNIPEWGNTEAIYLDLVSDVLSQGKTSRLYKRLVYDEQIATNAGAFTGLSEIGGQFYFDLMVKQGEDPAKVEKAAQEELAKFLKDGPTESELERIKTQYIANFVRGIERIGGFGGKSDILAQNEVYGGTPDYYKKTLEIVKNATAKDLQNAAVKWLSDGDFIIEIKPYPQFKASTESADRTKLPETTTPPDAKFPKIEKATLSNGLKIMLSKVPSIPVVNFSLLVDAGYAADQFAAPGVANMTLNMMDEGTKTKDALQISEALLKLGAQLSTSSSLDLCNVYLSSLKQNLDKSLELWADVILNPSFPEKELDRLKKDNIAQIQREKVNPASMGMRVFPVILYGKEHAYGIPFSGTGYEKTTNDITVKALQDFHKTWFKPNNTTLVVVGDISLDEVKSKLEKLFKDWKSGDVPKKNIANVKLNNKPVVYLLDKPEAPQSIIFAGNIASPVSDGDDIEIQSMNNLLGGSFTSRINMNLRENKHWSYGSRSMISGTKAQRPFMVYALIQSDKTKESMQEIYKELTGIIGNNPPTEDELNKVKLNQTLRLPGSWETMGAIGGSLSQLIMYNLPDNYFDKYVDKVKNLSLDDLSKAAKKILHPDNLIWVVVGDKTKIEGPIKELGYELKYIDTDGNLIN